MDWTALTALGLAAIGLGSAAGTLAGPVACTWPSVSSAALVERIRRLCDRPPGRRRRAAGGLGLALMMTGAGALAFAAQPSAPRRLAALARTVEADAHATPWLYARLPVAAPASLTPATATAPAAAEATPESFGRLPDQTVIDHYFALGELKYGDKFVSPARRNDPDARRLAAYGQMLEEEEDRRHAQVDAGERAGPWRLESWQDREAVLGKAAYADYDALSTRAIAADQAREDAALAAHPITGASSYYLPAGADRQRVMAAAGIDPRGVWSSSLPDNWGGRVVTRTYPSTSQYYASRPPAPARPGFTAYPGPEAGIQPPAPESPGA